MDTTALLNELSHLIRLTDNLAGLSSDKLKGIYESVQSVMAESQSYLERATVAEQHLGNLLARIHGDGGHYQDEQGTEKAVADADMIVVMLFAHWEERPAPADTIESFVQALGEVREDIMRAGAWGEDTPAVPDPWPVFRSCLECGDPWMWHPHELGATCRAYECQCQVLRSDAGKFVAGETPER